MDEGTIISVLERLGCRKINVRGNEVVATCPEEQRHRGGQDRNPSFSVRIEPDGRSPMGCFACQLGDTLEWYATQRGVGQFLAVREDIDDDREWLRKHAAGRARFDAAPDHLFLPPESALKPFVGRVPRYLMERGFALQTAKEWELGHDCTYRRLIFTIRDRLGRLRGLTGRTLAGHRAKYIHYNWDKKHLKFVPYIDRDREDDFIRFRRRLILYGEHKLDWSSAVNQDLYLCEGPTDVLALWQEGYRGVAPLGASLSEEQAETIVNMLPRAGRLVLAADGDAGGAALRASAYEQIGKRLPLYEVRIPDGEDPASLNSEKRREVLNNPTVFFTG